MKSITEYFLIPSFCVGVYSMYELYKFSNKIKSLENYVLSTHLSHMQDHEKQQEDIKDIYDMFEGVASSIPFTSKHSWQNKMLQRKLQREFGCCSEEDFKKKDEDEARQQMKDDIQLTEKVRLKTASQIRRLNDPNEPPQTRFYDDEFIMPDLT